MKHIAVAGLTNIETALRVEGFPLEYAKSRFTFHGIRDRIGGVGYNVSSVIAHQRHPVALLSLLGPDMLGDVIMAQLTRTTDLDAGAVLRLLSSTPRSVIAIDAEGRSSMFTDLKEQQETTYPPEDAAPVLRGAALLHASNINWALALAHIARKLGVAVSTDVQNIRTFDDPYNERFLRAADIVFLSGEYLEYPHREAIRRLWHDFDVRLVVIGLGANGAIVADRATGDVILEPATPLRPVVNVTGAGDSLAGTFLASIMGGFGVRDALVRGQLFAGYKIGEAGGAPGFPPLDLFEEECARRGVAHPTREPDTLPWQ